MRHEVKFEYEGQTHYGVVRSFCDDAKAAASRGNLVIDDAVLPKAYEVTDDEKVVDIKAVFGHHDLKTHRQVGCDEYRTYVQDQFLAAVEVAKKVDGVGVGAMFSLGVADGMAFYVVTKVNRVNCTVEWRGFGADRYYDHFFGWGRSVNKKDVARYIHKGAWERLR